MFTLNGPLFTQKDKMETIHLYDLSNLCRICLSKTDTMWKLFDISNGLYDILKSITNLELEENETFPNYLCSNCVDKINICQEVINKCKETNELLRRYEKNDFKAEDTKVTMETLPVTEIIELLDESDESNDALEERREQNEIKTEVNKTILRSLLTPQTTKTTEFTPQNDASRDLPLPKYNHCDFKAEDTKITLGSLLQTQAADFNASSKGSTRGSQETESDNQVKSQKARLKQFSVVSVIQGVDILKEKLNSIRKCVLCNIQARSYCVLADHMLKFHKHLIGRWCPTCNMIFENIETHWVTAHHEEKNTCKFCKRTLTSHYHLVEHLIGHTNQRPYKCSFCEKNFVQRSHLVEHTRIHTNHKPFKCDFCKKIFTRSSALKVHINVHIDEKPYKCVHCSYTCREKYRFNIHMREHGTVDSKCSYCYKTFPSQAILNSHLADAHLMEDRTNAYFVKRILLKESI